MKKFVANLLIFGVFAFCIYSVSTFAIMKFKLFFIVPNISNSTGGYAHSLERFREVENIENLEILFMGSSHCYRGFDPRIVGNNKTTFNLGNSAQTPYNTYYLGLEYLDKLKPEKVIFEAFWGPLGAPESAIESGVDIISNKNLEYLDIEMTFRQKNITAINSMFGNIFNRILEPLTDAQPTKFDSDTYQSGGYVSHAGNDGFEKTMKNVNKIKTIEYSDYQIEYFLKLISLCKSKNIEICITRAPVTKELISSISNYDQITNQLNEICINNNIVFQDYCKLEIIEEMGLVTTEDFFDSHHLNQSGVTKFNNYILSHDPNGIFK